MLIEFTVGNFRSFKDRVTFSMVAANLVSQDKNVDENNTFEVNDKLRLLKSAAIYGANASGKTNLVKAMQFMQNFVLTSSKESQADEEIPVEVFRLNETSLSEPSFFQIVFIQQGVQYRYGFEVTAERVTSEWLFAYGTTKEANLFQREMDAIRLSPTKFKEGKGLQDKTRKNALFLSVVAQFNGKIAWDVFEWFRFIKGYYNRNPSVMLAYSLDSFKKPSYLKELEQLLLDLDLSIQGIHIDQQEVTAENLSKDAPEAVKLAVSNGHKMDSFTIRTVHNVFDSQDSKTGTTLLDMDWHESSGTQKLFNLAQPILDSLKHGRIMIIDELDGRLHPLITRAIIRLFNSRKKNPLNAQLIFTTHDSNLLHKDIFRRDQIWFTDKNRQGATKLYSLVEFRVRNDNSSLESDYIHGKFGAIPFLGDLNSKSEESEAVSGAE